MLGFLNDLDIQRVTTIAIAVIVLWWAWLILKTNSLKADKAAGRFARFTSSRLGRKIRKKVQREIMEVQREIMEAQQEIAVTQRGIMETPAAAETAEVLRRLQRPAMRLRCGHLFLWQ